MACMLTCHSAHPFEDIHELRWHGCRVGRNYIRGWGSVWIETKMGSEHAGTRPALRFRNRLLGRPQGIEIMIQPFSFHEREVVVLLDDTSARPENDLVERSVCDAVWLRVIWSSEVHRVEKIKYEVRCRMMDGAFAIVPRTMYGIALQDSAYQTRGSTAIGCRTMTMRCTLCLLSF